jgi:hypothetical protein
MTEEYDVYEVIDSSGQVTLYETDTGKIVPQRSLEDLYTLLTTRCEPEWSRAMARSKRPEVCWPEVYRVARSMRWLSTPPLPWPTEDVRAQLGSRRQRQDVSMLCDFMGVLMTTNQRDIMERYLRDHPR